MPFINTADISPSHPDIYQIYNGMDCCITAEIFSEILEFDPGPVYSFNLGIQAPAMEMMLQGMKVDFGARDKAVRGLQATLDKVDRGLQLMAMAVWGKPLNANSYSQLLSFFYSHLDLPKIFISQKGVRKLSVNKEVLEKLEVHKWIRPIVLSLKVIRDIKKQISVLQTSVDPDGFMRTSYNIAGTETGRFSSSSSALGTGTNLQNIARELRHIFVAPSGWKLCGIDLEQAESRECGWLHGTLFGDWAYLDACESGDLHTTNCKLIWDEMSWPVDPKEAKILAEQPFYDKYSYRDMSKRGGHGSNYYGTPHTMARHLKVPLRTMIAFQERYFAVYPAFPKWHRWVGQQIQTTHTLTTPFGFTRHFFGRPDDDTTLREGIAFCPQSATGQRMNIGLWRVWKHIPEVRLCAQVHDAIYFLYRHEDEQTVIPKALGLIEVSLHHDGNILTGGRQSPRSYTIPGEAKIGWNWGDYSTQDNPSRKQSINLDGLKKFTLGTPDNRSRTPIMAR